MVLWQQLLYISITSLYWDEKSLKKLKLRKNRIIQKLEIQKQLFFKNYQILEKSELSSSRDGRDADGEK